MKKLVFILLLLGMAGSLWAQPTPHKVTVFASDPGVRFRVDGILYYGTATFFWVENSQHFLQFEASKDGFQYFGGVASDPTTRYVFGGWVPTGDDRYPPETFVVHGGLSATVYAHPGLTSIQVAVAVQYRVRLNFWNVVTPPSSQDAAKCAGDKNNGPGVVRLNTDCYYRNTDLWLGAGPLILDAYPYPGFAFAGWGVNAESPNIMISSLDLRSPLVLTAHFRPARRVKFFTEPIGMKVMLDRVPTITPLSNPCDSQEYVPAGPAPGAPRRCPADVDWLPGSKHVIGAESPQRDVHGNLWVFDSFNNGMGNHAEYEVTSLGPPETIVARFVRGARVSFVTQPAGLKLKIDGQDNWLSYNFVAAPGKVYSMSAPAEQVDRNGRKWVFAGWSNGGEADQEVTVPEEAVEKGFRLTARYELLSQLLIDTSPLQVEVEVNGTPCATPCSIDKPDGTEVTIAAPEQQAMSDDYRAEFHSWSDGGERIRTMTITGSDRIHLTANYLKLYRLNAGALPEGGAEFLFEPSSPDAFYQDGTLVKVTAKAKSGYRFRRWEGDLEGTHETGQLKLSRPRWVTAMMDEVDVAPPAWVGNAAGQTLEEIVAPGSLISIYSSTLAPHFHVGPANPLAQTLLGTTVRVDNWVLALLFVSPEQINAVLHPDIPEGRHRMIISRPGELDIETEFEVRRNAPGLFARLYDGQFFVMASHEDGRPVSPDDPAVKGEVISIYGTGFGPYDKIAPYGFALPSSPAFVSADPIELLAGEQPLTPESVGGAPGFSGTDLIRLKITDELPSATSLELKVRINGHESNAVLLPIQ